MAIIKIRNPAIDLDAAEIPNLDASKITSGTIDTSRISGLPASAISSGTFADARISSSSVVQHSPETDLQPVKSDISALALREATNESSAAFNLPNQHIDTFATDTLGTKTDVSIKDGYSYSATLGTGVYNTSDRTGTFNKTAGTITTDLSWANTSTSVDKLFDGDNSTESFSNSTYLDQGTSFRLSNHNLFTLDAGSNAANHLILDGYKFYGNGSNQSAASNPSGKVQGSNNNTDWTDLVTVTNNFFVTSGTSTQESTWTNTTAYRYYRWLGTSGVMSNSGYWFEVELREAALTTNATGTAIQAANTVGSAKTKVGGTILYKDNAGTATLGTDLKIYFTCNGGTNWTEASSYSAITPVYSTGIKQVRLGETTCTSVTDVRYKVEWANQVASSKETQLHGIGINY